MLSKISCSWLPRKQVYNPSDSIESITYIHNEKLEAEYLNQKEAFKYQNKTNKHGDVREIFLFHGTAMESVEGIIADNFLIDSKPLHQVEESGGEGRQRKKAMLFGRGIYLSEQPGISLMYGSGLLLCKVLLGNCEIFQPKGEIPAEIPGIYDSREVIKDGVGIVHVVKKPSQILPYCIIRFKTQSLSPMNQTMTPTKIQHKDNRAQYYSVSKQVLPGPQCINNPGMSSN